MRILTFTSLFPDRTRVNFGLYVYQRMSHVARRPGNTVTVVSPVPWVPSWLPGKKAQQYRAVPREEIIGNLHAYHPRYLLVPKAGTSLHGLLMFISVLHFVRRLAKQGFDCIDSHFVYPDGMAAVLLGRALKLPVIVSARGTDINLYPSVRTIRPFLQWTVKHATGLTGVCSALSNKMVELGANPENVRTIGNGIDISRFFLIDRKKARAALNLPIDKRIVLSVGSLARHKGFHKLIPAISTLNEKGLDTCLYIAGEGAGRSAIEEQIKMLGLEQHVILLGNIPNDLMNYWYNAADVSCLASEREGWANVLLESMACGTPVVATRIWGTPEVVTSEEVGILVDQTTEALSCGLEFALQHGWKRERIVAYARQRSWDVVAAEVEEWLEENIRRPRPS